MSREKITVIPFNPAIKTKSGETPSVEEYLPRAVGKALGLNGFASNIGGPGAGTGLPNLSDEQYHNTMKDITSTTKEMYLRLDAEEG